MEELAASERTWSAQLLSLEAQRRAAQSALEEVKSKLDKTSRIRYAHPLGSGSSPYSGSMSGSHEIILTPSGSGSDRPLRMRLTRMLYSGNGRVPEDWGVHLQQALEEKEQGQIQLESQLEEAYGTIQELQAENDALRGQLAAREYASLRPLLCEYGAGLGSRFGHTCLLV